MARVTKEIEQTAVKTAVKKAPAVKKSAATKKTTTAKKATTTNKAATTKKATTVKKTTTTSKTATAKKATATKKATTTRKTTTAKKPAATKKTATAKKATATKKAASTKKATTTKKAAVTKKTATAKKTTTAKKATATKKAASTKKATPAKRTTTRKKAVSKKETQFRAEYYDLPFMYNKTVVKVLAQTPKMLFIYWEIAEEDRIALKENFGENFFNNTRPVLIIYNDTMHYSFEVIVDDFANSWYLPINDANCDYHVELGRRPFPGGFDQSSAYIPYYVYLTSSNEMTSPNNKIMFDPSLKKIRFRNVKTGEITERSIQDFPFITNLGIYNIQDLYKYLYPNESFDFENIMLNGSSGALLSGGSGMFSSQFK